ncbi:MAG: hypothetical protein LAP39_10140 [Acidobacteriia bacterium]|nr:hypothetical protein [Terriglobia bacterium]
MDTGETLELIGGQQLQLERLPDANVIRVKGPEGAVKLTIHVTPSGPVLHIDGDGLEIRCSGALAINAQHLILHGREGLELSTAGDAAVRCQGDLHVEARAQTLIADLGDVKVRANDDVILDGERIRMNC